MRNDILAYARSVVDVEWPDQAAGRTVPESQSSLNRLTRMVLHLQRADTGDDLHPATR